MSVSLDKETFFRRMKRLYAIWKNGQTETGESFPHVDAICVPIGNDNSVLYCKSISLQVWLFGYDISDGLMIFTTNSINFMASRDKIGFLRQTEQHKDNSVPPIHLYVRNKDGNDKDNFDKLISSLKKSRGGKSLGVFTKDNFPGSFVEAWKKAIEDEHFDNVDISNAIGSLMSTKEESEVAALKKASQITVDIYQKYLYYQIMDIINSDRKVEHSKLADGIMNAMTDKKYVGNIDSSQLETCYSPIIQSGGKYSLKFSVTSDSNILHFGVIICSFGFRYKFYCSNIIRTLLVNPNDSVKINYAFLVDLHEHLRTVLKAGTRLCDVYNKGIQFATEKRPELVEKLLKSFGFVTGIEFNERSLSISSKTTVKACKSQIFNLCVGLVDLVNEKSSEKYWLFVGDTVFVNDDSPATILTPSKKRIKNVEIFSKKDSKDDGEKSEKENEPSRDQQILGRGKRTTVLDSKLRDTTTSISNDSISNDYEDLFERMKQLEMDRKKDRAENADELRMVKKDLNEMKIRMEKVEDFVQKALARHYFGYYLKKINLRYYEVDNDTVRRKVDPFMTKGNYAVHPELPSDFLNSEMISKS